MPHRPAFFTTCPQQHKSSALASSTHLSLAPCRSGPSQKEMLEEVERRRSSRVGAVTFGEITFDGAQAQPRASAALASEMDKRKQPSVHPLSKANMPSAAGKATVTFFSSIVIPQAGDDDHDDAASGKARPSHSSSRGSQSTLVV